MSFDGYDVCFYVIFYTFLTDIDSYESKSFIFISLVFFNLSGWV